MKWRKEIKSPYYDYKSIRNRIDDLKRAREENNLQIMINLVRTCISRNWAGTFHPFLHNYALSGTKLLIEEFFNELSDSIDYLDQHIPSNLVKKELFKTLKATIGNTALLLSGGANMGMSFINT